MDPESREQLGVVIHSYKVCCGCSNLWCV
jgi:hypothetical protein